MAGPTLGASAPLRLPPAPALPVQTRTRRTFGMVTLQGGETITVLASRRADECSVVQVLVGLPDDPALCLHGWVEPVQARVLARALIEAASAAEAAQRRMVLEQPAARHACPRCGCGHVGDYAGPGLHRCPTCREVLQRVEGQQP